ncbi:MAG: NADH:flavin oxidoreductase/NADH oxidase [Proteobacteria bacterium]|nr:NADH:flavin oxidoreductase/NADH oxidase [Pseudomonadota bacterium]
MSGMFDALEVRGVSFKNRIAVSPMSQYRAKDGLANDWHLVHLGRFALGGAGLVFAEATAVEEAGRRTHGDLGLWEDRQIEPLLPVTKFIAAEGAIPGIQLGHAGRKASERRPWHGETPVDELDIHERNEAPWTAMAPSSIPYADGWPAPIEMSETDIETTLLAFKSAARRSKEAGFKVIEIYAAHGFLVHQFLSSISNQRTDKWGGNAERRRRFAVEVARAVRSDWPEEYPLIFRLSATDWLEGGLEVEEVIETARVLAAEGVDMIDCSSGGIGGRERPRRMKIEQGFQVPFAARIRKEARIATMAVGFLWDATACQAVIENGHADMIAMARELLDDPNWPLHAAALLGEDTDYAMWHEEFGYWLDKRDRLTRKLGLR